MRSLHAARGATQQDGTTACAPRRRCPTRPPTRSRVPLRRRTPHPCAAAAAASVGRSHPPQLNEALDAHLSNRWIDLDEQGYFIVGVQRDDKVLYAEHYTNTINDSGQACDESGEPIACSGAGPRRPTGTYRGRTAKELSVTLLEGEGAPFKALRADHANYLGREFQKAEFCLLHGQEYMQD